MDVSIEETGALSRAITVVVPEKDVSKRLKKAYRKLASDVTIKGFRKGKVPQKILEKNYGEDVHNQVADELVQETYFDVLGDTKLDAVVHPDIRSHNFDEAGTFTYVAEIDVKPEFELGGYKDLDVELPEFIIEDETVAKRLEELRREHAPLRTVEDRASADGDILTIDFTAKKDGELMDNVKGSDYTVDIGSGKNGKEFEEALVGLKSGDETTKAIDFPADFANQLLAGALVEFQITVKDVKESILPELDDDFAKEVSADFSGLADLQDDVRAQMTKEHEEKSSGDLVDVIMLKLMENHDFPVPERLVAYEVAQHLKQLEDTLEKQGMDLEAAGLDREKLMEEYKGDAEKRVKGDFILKKIGEAEEIKVEDEDMTAAFQRIGDQYSMTVEQVKQYFARREDLLPLMHEILNEKIVEFLRNASKITYVPAKDEAEDK
ncbi:MAG: trigger factor [Thermodesulfobacteriota bacterium]